MDIANDFRNLAGGCINAVDLAHIYARQCNVVGLDKVDRDSIVRVDLIGDRVWWYASVQDRCEDNQLRADGVCCYADIDRYGDRIHFVGSVQDTL